VGRDCTVRANRTEISNVWRRESVVQAGVFCLGIIGEYLARIFLEVKGRPTFLIGSIVEGKDPAPKTPERTQSIKQEA
jgi:hypothetical protein